MIQEPYAIRKGDSRPELESIPDGFSAFHCLDHDHRYGAAILVKNVFPCTLQMHASSNSITCVRLTDGQSVLQLISAYCRPSIPDLISIIQQPLQEVKDLADRTILCLDSNAKSPAWNSTRLDERGKELEAIASRFGFAIANVKKPALDYVPPNTAFIDVTLIGSRIQLNRWRYLSELSLSDHPYIFLETICPTTSDGRKRVPLGFLEWIRWTKRVLRV